MLRSFLHPSFSEGAGFFCYQSLVALHLPQGADRRTFFMQIRIICLEDSLLNIPCLVTFRTPSYLLSVLYKIKLLFHLGPFSNFFLLSLHHACCFQLRCGIETFRNSKQLTRSLHSLLNTEGNFTHCERGKHDLFLPFIILFGISTKNIQGTS